MLAEFLAFLRGYSSLTDFIDVEEAFALKRRLRRQV